MQGSLHVEYIYLPLKVRQSVIISYRIVRRNNMVCSSVDESKEHTMYNTSVLEFSYNFIILLTMDIIIIIII